MIKPVASSAVKPVDPALKQAAQGFEALLLRQMIGSMRQARLAEDILGSSASDTYRDMADRQLAETMAKQGTLGIAPMVEAQFAGKAKAK